MERRFILMGAFILSGDWIWDVFPHDWSGKLAGWVWWLCLRRWSDIFRFLRVNRVGLALRNLTVFIFAIRRRRYAILCLAFALSTSLNIALSIFVTLYRLSHESMSLLFYLRVYFVEARGMSLVRIFFVFLRILLGWFAVQWLYFFNGRFSLRLDLLVSRRSLLRLLSNWLRRRSFKVFFISNENIWLLVKAEGKMLLLFFFIDIRLWLFVTLCLWSYEKERCVVNIWLCLIWNQVSYTLWGKKVFWHFLLTFWWILCNRRVRLAFLLRCFFARRFRSILLHFGKNSSSSLRLKSAKIKWLFVTLCFFARSKYFVVILWLDFWMCWESWLRLFFVQMSRWVVDLRLQNFRMTFEIDLKLLYFRLKVEWRFATVLTVHPNVCFVRSVHNFWILIIDELRHILHVHQWIVLAVLK